MDRPRKNRHLVSGIVIRLTALLGMAFFAQILVMHSIDNVDIFVERSLGTLGAVGFATSVGGTKLKRQ